MRSVKNQRDVLLCKVKLNLFFLHSNTYDIMQLKSLVKLGESLISASMELQT